MDADDVVTVAVFAREPFQNSRSWLGIHFVDHNGTRPDHVNVVLDSIIQGNIHYDDALASEMVRPIFLVMTIRGVDTVGSRLIEQFNHPTTDESFSAQDDDWGISLE